VEEWLSVSHGEQAAQRSRAAAYGGTPTKWMANTVHVPHPVRPATCDGGGETLDPCYHWVEDQAFDPRHDYTSGKKPLIHIEGWTRHWQGEEVVGFDEGGSSGLSQPPCYPV
jgi:hypothetical protein